MTDLNNLKYPIHCYHAELEKAAELNTFIKHAIHARDPQVIKDVANHIFIIANDMRKLGDHCAKVCGDIDCISKYEREIPGATKEIKYYSTEIGNNLEQLANKAIYSFGDVLLGAILEIGVELTN